MSLYKYITEKRLSILGNGLIRFTQPQAFNDPFELKPHIYSLASKSFLEDDFNRNFDASLREVYEKQPIKFKKATPFSVFATLAMSKRDGILSSVIEMAKHFTPQIKELVHEGLEKNIGILSLTEKDNNLLMWAHYANSHKGLVVEFDETHRFFNQKKSEKNESMCLKKVEYSSQRPSLELSQVESINSFLVKGNAWEYEQEWRMLHPLAEADSIIENQPHDIHLFKVPFLAIKSVLIGVRATEETRKELTRIIMSNSELGHVKIYEMHIHESQFELEKKLHVPSNKEL